MHGQLKLAMGSRRRIAVGKKSSGWDFSWLPRKKKRRVWKFGRKGAISSGWHGCLARFAARFTFILSSTLLLQLPLFYSSCHKTLARVWCHKSRKYCCLFLKCCRHFDLVSELEIKRALWSTSQLLKMCCRLNLPRWKLSCSILLL